MSTLDISLPLSHDITNLNGFLSGGNKEDIGRDCKYPQAELSFLCLSLQHGLEFIASPHRFAGAAGASVP